MTIQNILDVAGLHTAENVLRMPPGAFVDATNIMVRSPDVIEPRRGQEPLSASTFGSNYDRANEVFFYRGTPLVHYAGTKLAKYDQGYTNFSGTIEAPSNSMRMKGIEAQQNFYLATKTGVLRVDQPTSATAYLSGGPRSLDMVLVAPTGSGGYLAASSQVAYRVVFGVRDANANLHLGAPSGRYVFNNTSTTTAVNALVAFFTPPGASTSVFYRLYRTAQTANTIDPGDEMGLVAEGYLSSTNVSNGYVSITDTTPDGFRGVPLYTNPNSGEGILQANIPPPWCVDLTTWQDRAWYGNTKQPQRLILSLLGTGKGQDGNTGLMSGDQLKFTVPNSWTYTITAAGSDGGTNFQLFTGGTPSVNVEQTARAIVTCINRNRATFGLCATYLSGPNDPPGKFMVERTVLNEPAFYAYVSTPETKAVTQLSRTGSTVTLTTTGTISAAVGDWIWLNFVAVGTPDPAFLPGLKKVTAVGTNYVEYSEAGSNTVITNSNYTVSLPNPGTAFNPTLSQTTGAWAVSTDDAAVNRVYYSKILQTEAVPLLNYLDVGTKGKAILRVYPQRDRLLVFKEEGIYAITGESPFAVDLVDDTTWLLCPDSIASVGNVVYAMTNQGVAAISGGGRQIVSTPIDRELQQCTAESSRETFKSSTFGVSHESDRLYSLWVQNPQIGRMAYVYGTLSGVWTKWSLERTCGRVNPVTDQLYMGPSGERRLWIEKRYLNALDYTDGKVTSTIVSTVQKPTHWDIELNSISGIAVGDGFVCKVSDLVGKVLAIDADGSTISVSGEDWGGVDGESAYATKAFTSTVQWVPFTAQNPSGLKQGREIHALFRRAKFASGSWKFSTDFESSESTETISNGDYDLFYTLLTPIGTYLPQTQRRVLIPQGKQRFTFLNVKWQISEPFADWALNGWGIFYEPVSERTGR